MKCDEGRPQCGPCQKGQRPCAYGSSHSDTKPAPADNPYFPGETDNSADADNDHEDANVSPDVQEQGHLATILSPTVPRHATTATLPLASPISYHTAAAISPATEKSLGGHAPYSWFELLATDVANTDNTFLLSPAGQVDAPAEALRDQDNHTSPSSDLLIPRNQREQQSFRAAAFGDIPSNNIATSAIQTASSPAVVLDDSKTSWNLAEPMGLSSQERYMLSHFIRHLSTWLDFFDPLRHFGSLVPHLALNNVGLLKALLALSARHISLCRNATPLERTQRESPDAHRSHPTEANNTIDRKTAVQYYYETLQYLHKAMHYKSYTWSRELVATALLISTYEMIDGSNKDWERHLKGVFWIQRSQDNDGECGGLRQAVWWTWLQQDIWVALMERRRVFSFWRPTRPLDSLNAPDLACRASYLLAQCVNYASREDIQGQTIDQRLTRGNELFQMIEEWKHSLPPEFNPLPTTSQAGDQNNIFPAIWIYPPSYAAAVQMHNLSRILLLMHRPLCGGHREYSIMQRAIRQAVEIVCGIARTVEKGCVPANYVSTLCLFMAGVTLHVPHERAVVLGLIESCEQQMTWSKRSLRMELESEWRKIDVGDA